jgi:3-deoxy-manno-octulosonate cytidylyltransferase (CMP-KDO synthetase)
MTVAILIPARLDGVRLPRKVLMDFFGLPMVEHVRRRAELANSNLDVYVVSGDQEVLETVANFQGKSIKTFAEHENGTSRCAEAAKQLNYQHFIVAQGDEILLLPRHLNEMIDELTKYPEISMLNSVAPLKGKHELFDESIVKCLIGHENRIVMMFRSPPNSQPRNDDFKIYHKVLGLFAFQKELLSEVSGMSPTNFEQRESIEQMRLLENGVGIKAFKVEKSYPSVNVTKDISEVLQVIELDLEQKEVLKLITDETL